MLLLQGYRPEQLAYGTGGPGAVENLYTEALLKEAFAPLDIIELGLHESVLREGTAHVGPSALIDLVAARPIWERTSMFDFLKSRPQGASPIETLSPKEIHDLMASTAVTLIDVREPSEVRAERIPGAINVPLSQRDVISNEVVQPLPCSKAQSRMNHLHKLDWPVGH